MLRLYVGCLSCRISDSFIIVWSFCAFIIFRSVLKAVNTEIFVTTHLLLLLLLLLLLFDMDISCHRPILPGTSLEPAVIPTAQASRYTLPYFPYYV